MPRLRDCGDHEDGLAQPLIQVAQNFEHRFGVFAVEIAGWLIGQQDRGVVDDGARDGHALLLAAGERVGLVIQPAGDAEQAQHLLELGVRVRAQARDVARHRDVVPRRQVGQQVEFLNTNPTVRRRIFVRPASLKAARFWPPTLTSPAVGGVSPPMM